MRGVVIGLWYPETTDRLDLLDPTRHRLPRLLLNIIHTPSPETSRAVGVMYDGGFAPLHKGLASVNKIYITRFILRGHDDDKTNQVPPAPRYGCRENRETVIRRGDVPWTH